MVPTPSGGMKSSPASLLGSPGVQGLCCGVGHIVHISAMSIEAVNLIKQLWAEVALHFPVKQRLALLLVNVHPPPRLHRVDHVARVDEERRVERVPLVLLSHARRVEVLTDDVQVEALEGRHGVVAEPELGIRLSHADASDEILSELVHVAKQANVLGAQVNDGHDVLSGHDEVVVARLRVAVHDGDRFLVLLQNLLRVVHGELQRIAPVDVSGPVGRDEGVAGRRGAAPAGSRARHVLFSARRKSLLLGQAMGVHQGQHNGGNSPRDFPILGLRACLGLGIYGICVSQVLERNAAASETSVEAC